MSETSAKDCVKVLADTVLDRVRSLAGSPSPAAHAPVALVVCNTVDRARAVHERLGRLLAAAGAGIEADCELLIGRARPVDRPDLQDRILGRFGVDREPVDRAAVLVATQTVEVGVNLDADVLVTESASWDALVQRLGRVNRLGKLRERFPDRPAAAAVVVHDGQADGPVYGTARDDTWGTFRDLATDAVDHGYDGLDVCPLACRQLTHDRGPFAGEGFARRPGAVPVVLTPTLDAWVQTAPVPLVDPPIEPFLHGFDGGVAAVRVLWRGRLVGTDPSDDPWGDEFDDPWGDGFGDDTDVRLPVAEIEARLVQWPPRTPEIVEVPFVAVRQWMRGETPQPVDDLESAPETESRTRPVGAPFEVLAQRAARPGRPGNRSGDAADTALTWQWINADALRPGDLVVVPAERGGLDAYGWAPAERRHVVDVAEVATFVPSRSRRKAALRLDDTLADRLGLSGSAADEVRSLLGKLLDEREDGAPPPAAQIRAFGQALGRLLPPPQAPPTVPGWTTETWRRLHLWLDGPELAIVEVSDPSGRGIVDGAGPRVWERTLVGPVPDALGASLPGPLREGDDEEVGISSGSAQPVTLAVHHGAVRRRAGEIATALGLAPELCTVVEDAAGWHDLGKVEERFQAMLHDGDAYEAALAAEPLAKSGMDPTDRMAFRRARRRSGLPPGARHEAWSAALVQEHVRTNGYPGDVDLLVHLVASHHGYARPLARLVVDTDPRSVEALVEGEKVTVASDRTVSLEHPARFARLNERYGRWGVALLEAVVRCADVTVSEEGS